MLKNAIAAKLMRVDAEVRRVALHEIPRVCRELVADLGDEIARAKEAHAGVAAKTDTQEVVESREMVHMGVTHEDVTHPKERPRGEGADVADVEQDGATLELEVDAQPRVAPYTVDQPRVE